MRLIIVTETDLYGNRKTSRDRYTPARAKPAPRPLPGLRVTDLTDIEPGDHVVHVEYGIGIYMGLNEIMTYSLISEKACGNTLSRHW